VNSMLMRFLNAIQSRLHGLHDCSLLRKGFCEHHDVFVFLIILHFKSVKRVVVYLND